MRVVIYTPPLIPTKYDAKYADILVRSMLEFSISICLEEGLPINLAIRRKREGAVKSPILWRYQYRPLT
jgi:hypothetical protein